MLERFRPHENERGLTFGLTWSAVGCAIALAGLTSCGYLIPEDTRPPRYNTVVGERRSPMLNSAVGENMPDPDTGEYPAMTGAPMPQPVNPNSPPPSSADYPVPTASVQVPNGAMPSAAGGAPQRSFWDKTRGWVFGEDAEINGTPVPLGAPLPPGAMKDVPDDVTANANNINVAMGSSSEYPKLEEVNDVPPASVDARDRLQQAQDALIIDKDRAAYERDAAAREAASEPTLLEQYKQGKLPPAPQPQPLTPNDEVSVNLPSTSNVPQAAHVPSTLPEPDMVIDLSTPEAELAPELVEAPPPPPPPTVNVVRGVQSETVEIREPVTDTSGAGYLPAPRYEMRAATTN